jgi:hypothetical protein
MVIIPAQFKPTVEDENGELIGTFKKFSSLSFELQRSDSTDWQPPEIHGVDLNPFGTGRILVTVDVSDDAPTGVKSVFAIRINGELEVFPFSLTETGDWIVDIPWTTADKLIIQASDYAGNVITYTGRGANLSLITVDAGPDKGFEPGEGIDFTATLDFNSLIEPVFYTMDFGDDKPAVSGQVFGDSFTVPDPPHEYTGVPSQAIATLKVTDSDGGIGIDTVHVTIKTEPVISIDSSVSPSIVGQPVTFTANVSANMTRDWPIWLPTPAEGTVTFYADGIEFATVPVTEFSEGVAIASAEISSLDPGWHEITANYSGDVFFLPSQIGGMNEPQKVEYRFGGLTSPIPDSQYEIGRTIPIKFNLSDFNFNSVGTASTEINIQINDGDIISDDWYPIYNDLHYQFNDDTSLLDGAIPGDLLNIIVLLDDGTDHSVSVRLK